KDSSYEYFYEATGGNQSLNLNIDTSLGTFVGLTVSNRRKNRNSSDSIKWEFFQCNVLKLQ
ncbi:hypothetical protein ACI3PL_21810, partial [Lacticaseibacillus paracasei]